MLLVIRTLIPSLHELQHWISRGTDNVLDLLFEDAFSSEQFAHSKLKWVFLADYCTADISALLCVFGTEQQASSSSCYWSCVSPEVLMYFGIVLLQQLQNFTTMISPPLYSLQFTWRKPSKFQHWISIYLSCHIDRIGWSMECNITCIMGVMMHVISND